MEQTKTFVEFGTEFGLDPDLLQGLADMGYTHPTPVQAEAMPAVSRGKDVMVQARTGTGKTLGFGLPTLNRIERTSPDTQVLVIAPTRELAVQVADELGRVAKYLQIIVAVVFGGVKVLDQVDEMQWAPVVVGTPGRLRDMYERGYLNLDSCKVVVLDEADEMLDMGFKDDLEFILSKMPKERQTLLFSATFPPEIERIAHKYMREPEKIAVSSGFTAATGLMHKFARVPKDKKIQALATLLRQPDVSSSIIFCETKTETAWVFQRLKREGFSIGIITGDIPQEKRLQTLQAFRDGELNILVATDVAARGLDIPAVSHVFHFTVPRETATYIHRSGRTARAGKKGIAFTLVTPEEDRDFQRIMRDIKQNQQQGQPAQAQPGQPAQARQGRPERGERREERGERREGREVREGREGREVREGREIREGREGREGRERQPMPAGGREERRPEARGPEGRRERFERRPEERRQEMPQRPAFVPPAQVPSGLADTITSLGGQQVDAFMGVAQSLLQQGDAARLVAALLSQNPRAIALLEASQAQAQAQAPRAEGERRPEGERRERGRDRHRRSRVERGEGRPERAEARPETLPAAPAAVLTEAPRVEERAPEVAPAPVRVEAPVQAPVKEEAPAPARPARTTRRVAAPAAEAPAPTPAEAPAAPAAVAEPAAEAKPTRARRPRTTKAAEAPAAEAPVTEAQPEEAKPKRRTTTRAKKATTEEAPATEAPAAEAPAEEAKPKRRTTTRAKKATT